MEKNNVNRESFKQKKKMKTKFPRGQKLNERMIKTTTRDSLICLSGMK